MIAAKLRVWGYYVLLWVVSIVFVSPVLWIALSAFKTRNDILATPPKLLFTPTLENFVHLFARNELWRPPGREQPQDTANHNCPAISRIGFAG